MTRPALRRARERRRLRFVEQLEDRRLMALGDLLETIDTPTAEVQAGSHAGFALSSNGAIGAPLHDVTKNGETFPDAGRVVFGLQSIDNPTPHAGDQFGYALDGGFVSAPFDDTGALNSGVVHYGGSKIANPTPGVDAHFGLAVARAGDYVFVSAAAPGDSPNSGGAVYMFDATRGTFLRTFRNPTPKAGDEFGKSISASTTQIVIGAPGDDAFGADSGRVYVFNYNGTLLRTLQQPNPKAGDRFGFSSRIDVNAGFNQTSIIVGAPGVDAEGKADVGRAFTYSVDSGALELTLNNPSPDAGDQFGWSVFTSHNSTPQIIIRVGAPYDDTGATNSGQVFTFDTNGDLVSSSLNPTPATDDLYGFALGDFGTIGAPGADELGKTDPGARYQIGSPTPSLAWDIVPNGSFGKQAVVAGPWLFVSEPDLTGEDINGFTKDIGRVHQFDAATGALVYSYVTTNQGSLGVRLAASNGRVAISQGLGEIAVFDASTHELLYTTPTNATNTSEIGTPFDISADLLVVGDLDFSSSHQGVVSLYDAATGNLVRTITSPQTGGGFGQAVAVNDGLVAVLSNGKTQLFTASTGELLRTLTTPGASTVLLVNGRVIVGAPNGSGGGKVLVFDAATGEPLHTIAAADNAAGFGASLSASGDTLLVGESGFEPDAIGGKMHVVYLPTGAILKTIAPADATYDFADGLAIYGSSFFVGDRLARGSVGQMGRVHRFDGTFAGIYLRGIDDERRFVENATRAFLAPAATFSNPTHISFNDGTLSVAISDPEAEDRLEVAHKGTGPGQIAVQGSDILFGGSHVATFAVTEQGAKLDVQFDSSISDEAIQAILRRISFVNPREDLTNGDRTVTTVLTDTAGIVRASVQQTIVVKAVEDGGVLSMAGSVSYTENDLPVLLAPQATYTDVDGLDFSRGSINGTVVGGAKGDSLLVLHEGAGAGEVEVVVDNPQSGKVYLDGQFIAQYFYFDVTEWGFQDGTSGFFEIDTTAACSMTSIELLLRRIAFQTSGDNPTDASRTITFFVAQSGPGGGESNVETVAVDVVPVNDAPIISLDDSSAYLRNTPPIAIAPSASITDPDTPDFAAGSLEVAISENGAPADVLAIRDDGTAAGQIGVSGADVTYGGEIIGMWEGGTAGEPLIISFNASVTAESAQALARAITFVTPGDAPSTTPRTVTFSLTDGEVTRASDSTTVKVFLQEAPVLAPDAHPSLLPTAEDAPFPTRTLVRDLVAGIISDRDPDALRGIAIVQAGQADGTWQYLLKGDPTWHSFGDPAETAALLLPADDKTSIRFVPNLNFNGNAQFEFRAWDQTEGTPGTTFDLTGHYGEDHAFSTSSATATISVTPVNDAPVLDTSFSPKLPSIAEDTLDPPSTQVLTLLKGAVTDVDAGALRGIAITTAQGIGSWQYTLNGTTWIGMDNPSIGQALLLPGWARVRFLPELNFNGEIKIWYRAWDQTEGTVGGRLDVQSKYTGGSRSVSLSTDNATLWVKPVNDAPVLDTTPDPALNPVWEDATSPGGTLVRDFAAAAISDVDANARKGIAVTSVDSENGKWQFSLDGGKNWQDFGVVSEGSARLLPVDGLTKVRFIPNKNFDNQVSLTFRAWDRTEGSAGGTLSTFTRTGGQETFSSAFDIATLTMVATNDKPVLSVGGAVGYVHDQPGVALAPFGKVQDVDSFDFDGGWLRVHIAAGAGTSNRLQIGGEFTIDADNNVLLGSAVIGTRASNGFGTNDLLINFKPAATRAIVQQLVRSILFKTVGGAAGTRGVQFSVADGDGGVSDVVEKTVNVT